MSDDLTEDQISQIRDEMRAGRKLAAVKLYKSWTGSSLVAAKNYVEQVADGLETTSQDFGRELNEACMDQVLDAIQAGNKLQAIKLYKEATGRSLVDSKSFIENLMADMELENPGSVPDTAGCGLVILIAIVASTGVVFSMT